jgi:hypothetical protein
MKKFFFTVLISSILFAFAKPPKNQSTTNWVEKVTIYGKWTWIKTECCGTKKGITTPESYGDNIMLEILPDNTFKEISAKHRVPREGNIYTSTVNKDNKTIKTIQFNDERPAHYDLSPSGDTLILSWEHLELQKETYVRNRK